MDPQTQAEYDAINMTIQALESNYGQMYGEQEDGSSQADTEPYDPDPVDKVTTPKEPP